MSNLNGMPGPTSRHYFSQRLRLHYVDWGNRRRAAAAAGAWRARPLPQLGLGGRRRCARTGTSSPRPARPRRQPVVARRQLHRWRATSTTSPSSSISRSWRRSPSSPIRSAATSPCAMPASIPRTCAKLVAIEGLGPSPKVIAERGTEDHRRAHARLDRRAARPLRPPAAPLSPPSRTPSSACRRRTSTSRPSRRATSPQHGVNQNEDGTYSWKFDNYVRAWPPYDMTLRRHRGSVGAHRLPDPAGLRQGELGLQSGEGRPR